MKKGAIHIDWVISVGIFLVYIIVLLVLIKPSYKSNYEGNALTKMIKDEFLGQNNVTAGFVVFKAENCYLEEGISVIEKLGKKLPENIQTNEINIKIIERDKSYKAYFLDEPNLDLSSGTEDLRKCESVEIKEIFYYNALKNSLDFKTNDFNFPSSRKYKIRIYKINEVGNLVEGESFGIEEKPSGDDKVYVLDWSAAKLCWDATNKEIKRGNWNDNNKKCEEGNIIINIRVW